MRVARSVLVGFCTGVRSSIGVRVGRSVLVGLRCGVVGSIGVRVARSVLVGFCTGVRSSIGVLVGRVVLVGLRTGVRSSIGVLVGRAVLVGLRTGVRSSIGVLVGRAVLVGLRTGVSATIGVLVGRVVLVGLRSGVRSVIGVLVGRAVLVGLRVEIPPCAYAVPTRNMLAKSAVSISDAFTLNMPVPPFLDTPCRAGPLLARADEAVVPRTVICQVRTVRTIHPGSPCPMVQLSVYRVHIWKVCFCARVSQANCFVMRDCIFSPAVVGSGMKTCGAPALFE